MDARWVLLLSDLNDQISHGVYSVLVFQVEKNSFQRITYRIYDANSGTLSSLELFPQSQLLQDIHTRLPISFDVQCEVSILSVYHKSVSQRVRVAAQQHNATISLNSLDSDTHKRNAAGDPDNAPLTGSAVLLVKPSALKSSLFAIIATMLAIQLNRSICNRS